MEWYHPTVLSRQEKSSRKGWPPADHLASATSNYTYDAIYQLTQVTQANNTTESFSYDAVGNRTASLGVSSYTTNASNELTATSNAGYTYDSNGNALTKTVGSNTTTYAWDYENRLTSVTLPGSGGTVTFKYNPLGRRIEKVSPTTTSIFAYDGDNLIEETNSSGAVVSRYTQTQNIDEPLAMLRSSATSYYNADGLGSITSLTNASGTTAQTYTYDSFGKVTASSGSLVNPFQYTGREMDAETGLYYYRARYYDSVAGRFLSEDPTRSGMNFYRYVHNRPSVLIDPSGEVDVVHHEDIVVERDIDSTCGITAGGCNHVDYSPQWKCSMVMTSNCDQRWKAHVTITLIGDIFVAQGPYPYKGRNPADPSITNRATAIAHEQLHTADKLAAIVPIFERVESQTFATESECEQAAEAAALQAAPAWTRANADSQRRRH